MSTTLLTFLGRVPKNQGTYRRTAYEFPDGSRSREVAFFGWPLAERIRPDRLVILGTSGSMWDHLFEGDLDLGEQGEADRLALVEAVEKKAVSTALLTPLAPLLAERLGYEIKLALIPYGRGEAEQVELLRILAGCVCHRETVHLDVTHGFRHLPMLALLAALHLRLVKEAVVAGIWYGAYDPDTEHAPVHELSGLLRLADWLQALATYDKDGDYGVFSPLLGGAGEALRRAAFFERTTNPVKARQWLSGWKEHTGSDPAYDLFRDQLHRRIAWYRKPERPQQEAALAWHYLAHRDWLRAAIYGLEAVISRQVCGDGGNFNDYDCREAAREKLRASSPHFKKLNRLRNAMAHGVKNENREILQALEDQEKLDDTLKEVLKELLS